MALPRKRYGVYVKRATSGSLMLQALNVDPIRAFDWAVKFSQANPTLCVIVRDVERVREEKMGR